MIDEAVIETDQTVEDDQTTKSEQTESVTESEDKTETKEPHWRDFVGEDFKKASERFNTPDDMLKSIEDMRKLMSDRIKVPGDDASEEDVAKFRKQLNVPETADNYKSPEGLEENELATALVDSFKPIAFAANLSQEGFDQIVQKWNDFAEQAENERMAQITKARDQSITELKKEMGSEFDGNVQLGVRAMKQIGGEELGRLLDTVKLEDGSLLGDHPAMVRFGSKLGRQMSEDGVIMPVDRDQAKDMQTRIQELTNKIHTSEGPERAAFIEERSQLTERLVGTGPIVGAPGRTV